MASIVEVHGVLVPEGVGSMPGVETMALAALSFLFFMGRTLERNTSKVGEEMHK